MYRTISISVALGLLGLAASASANLVANGDFEADLGSTIGTSIADFTQSVSGWFEKNGAIKGDALQWDGTGSAAIPGDDNGEVWGLLNVSTSSQTPANSPGAFYQSIGTYSDNMQVLVALTVGKRSDLSFPNVDLKLYSGNVTGADGSWLPALGATLLDTYTITDSVFTTAPEAVALSGINLATGSSGVDGETLWLEISAVYPGFNDSDHQALVDDIVVSDGVVTWTGSGDGVSLFDEANWDAAGGVLSGDYVSKTGTTPYDLVIDIAGSVGGANGWGGTLDLDNVGSITVSTATFKMSSTAVIKNGSASVTGSNNGYIQGTLDNADFWSNGGLSLLGPMHLINGSTLEATWFAGGNGVSSLDGGSTLTIREDASGTFINNTVDFLDVESKIVYSNIGRTVAEVTSEHVSRFTVNGETAVVGSNIYVYADAGTGYTTVRRPSQVMWTGGDDGISLFKETNWDADGGALSGDYVSKTGTSPYDFVIDIAGSVGGGGGWDGTLDLGGVGSLTVTNAANYFRMNTSGNATLKNGTAYFKSGSGDFDFQGTWDNIDVTIGQGINLAGSLALINGTTVDTAWFADNSASLNGGSILTIREDSATSFQNNTVDFLDLDSRIVYSNTGRTVAEVTSEHVSHFLANGAAALLNSNIYVDKESSTGQTIVHRNRQITWTGTNSNGYFFQNGNWDVDDVVVKVAEVCTLDNRDLVIDIAGKPTYIVGGDSGINGTLDLNNNSRLIVTNNADSFRMRTDGSLVIKNGTAWFKSGTGNFDFQGTFDNMDVYVNWGTDLAGSLDLINGSTFDTRWFANGGACDIDGGSTLIIREDSATSFQNTTVNFLDLESKIVYSNAGRTIADVTSEHLSHFTVNGDAAVVGENIRIYTDSGTGFTSVRAFEPTGTLFRFR